MHHQRDATVRFSIQPPPYSIIMATTTRTQSKSPSEQRPTLHRLIESARWKQIHELFRLKAVKWRHLQCPGASRPSTHDPNPDSDDRTNDLGLQFWPPVPRYGNRLFSICLSNSTEPTQYTPPQDAVSTPVKWIPPRGNYRNYVKEDERSGGVGRGSWLIIARDLGLLVRYEEPFGGRNLLVGQHERVMRAHRALRSPDSGFRRRARTQAGGWAALVRSVVGGPEAPPIRGSGR